MTYEVLRIRDKEELSRCPVFEVKHYGWNSKRSPETFGRMGHIAGAGLYLRMTCIEEEPKREYKSHRSMVCKDSAMEAFFAFPDTDLKQTAQPGPDSLYLNFEINANGAMLAQYGRGRGNRRFITRTDCEKTGVKAFIEPDRWSCELLIPEDLLKRVAGIVTPAAGSVFFCNFYKISEDPDIEHYAAYSPLPGEKPDFHQPRYFARAILRD